MIKTLKTSKAWRNYILKILTYWTRPKNKISLWKYFTCFKKLSILHSYALSSLFLRWLVSHVHFGKDCFSVRPHTNFRPPLFFALTSFYFSCPLQGFKVFCSLTMSIRWNIIRCTSRDWTSDHRRSKTLQNRERQVVIVKGCYTFVIVKEWYTFVDFISQMAGSMGSFVPQTRDIIHQFGVAWS